LRSAGAARRAVGGLKGGEGLVSRERTSTTATGGSEERRMLAGHETLGGLSNGSPPA